MRKFPKVDQNLKHDLNFQSQKARSAAEDLKLDLGLLVKHLNNKLGK